MHKGCKVNAGVKDDFLKQKPNDEKEIQLFNDARETAIEQYLEIKKEILGNAKNEGGQIIKVDPKEWDAKTEIEQDEELF